MKAFEERVSDERIMGRWSLSQGSGWVDQDSFGVKAVEQKVRSMAERVPYDELRWVGAPGVFNKFKSSFVRRMLSNMLPREFV